MKRTLIICYSRRGWNYANGSVVYLERGNTEIAAEYIARETGAEIFGIETVKPYSDDETVLMAAFANTPCDYWTAGRIVAGAKSRNETLVDDFQAIVNKMNSVSNHLSL